MNATASQEHEGMPPSVIREAAVVLPLATSGFTEHFVERFVETSGRWLGVPWWVVHAGLYAITGVLSSLLVDLSKFFPGGGLVTLWGILAAEFLFTTWMLVHIRQTRTLALLAIARMDSGYERLTWMRRFFSPIHNGWIIRGQGGESNQRRPICLSLPVLTLLLVLGFYVDLFLWGVKPGVHDVWETFHAHLLTLYTLTVKAAMLLAVLAHFWLLRGLVELSRGAWSSSLTANARLRLLGETRRAAVRLNVILGVATAAWMFVYGFGVGITHWSYALSLGLLALFVTQGIILDGHKLRPARTIHGFGAAVGPMTSMFRQLNLLGQPAETWALATLTVCPVGANFAGNAISRLVSL